LLLSVAREPVDGATLAAQPGAQIVVAIVDWVTAGSRAPGVSVELACVLLPAIVAPPVDETVAVATDELPEASVQVSFAVYVPGPYACVAERPGGRRTAVVPSPKSMLPAVAVPVHAPVTWPCPFVVVAVSEVEGLPLPAAAAVGARTSSASADAAATVPALWDMVG